MTIIPDARLLALADILAGEIRIALDKFEVHDAIADTLPIDEEAAAAEAIMAPSEAIVDEMLTFKPSTFLGFMALDMACRWSVGEWPGMGPVMAEGFAGTASVN